MQQQVGMVRSIGLIAVTGALVGCSDASQSLEEPQGSLAQPVITETTARAPKKLPGWNRGYEVVIIDPVRPSHDPTAINNRGLITSSVINDEDVRQAWFWDGDQGHFLLGDRPDGAGVATDVNAAGVVVGSTLFLHEDSETPGSFQFRTRAFRYDGTAVAQLGVLDGNSHSRAEGINRYGDVAGHSYGGTGEQYAVLFRGDEIVDLGVGRAYAVNDRGQVVGGNVIGELMRAFVYTDGQHVDLGTLGGETSVATDINEGGDIVGNSLTASGATRAFLYRDGAMLELPVPGEHSSAAAINRHGQVVGVVSAAATPTVVDGYLYDAGRAKLLRDIIPQDGCWNRLDVRDINDHGDIVGLGFMNDYASCGEVGRYLVVVTRRPQRYR